MPSKKPANTDGGAAQVQERMDEITEQGFRGDKVDPTPNENYTVAGVIESAPTPETDVEAEAAAREAITSPFGGTATPGPLAAAEAEAEAVEEAAEEAEAEADED